MTVELAQRRCFHHHSREAVAQCPVCRRSFCRECITEHGGRMICVSCLQKESAPAVHQSDILRRGAGILAVLAGFLVGWFSLYKLGEWLLRLPSAFHEGTLWQ